ncbi:M56 family metallopeptidase [Mycobacterium sp. MBM]|nr:M56 family metallopeptidase [Mycobacterium sp. MBM]
MTAAVYLLAYGALLTWLGPPVLSRLTRGGLNPQLGVAAWLTAVVGALAAWAVAISSIAVNGLKALPDSPVLVVCLELLGVPEHVATPGLPGLFIAIAAGVIVSVGVGLKVGRSVLGLRSRSHRHAHAARLLGAPTGRPDVFLLDARRPAAYCVVGRPNAIVVTTAAVQRLTRPQLDAVLAHEDAHIAGRHHQVLMVLRALAATLPHLPLFPKAAVAVGELFEMCADDAAVRRHGSRALVAGMIELAGPVQAAGLGVGASAIAVRANRLLVPPRRGSVRGHRVLTWATIAATAGAPIVINLICRH